MCGSWMRNKYPFNVLIELDLSIKFNLIHVFGWWILNPIMMDFTYSNLFNLYGGVIVMLDACWPGRLFQAAFSERFSAL